MYVGGELGGLIHLVRSPEDGSLTMTRAWAASDFDEALQVYVTLRAEAMAQCTFLCAAQHCLSCHLSGHVHQSWYCLNGSYEELGCSNDVSKSECLA